MKAHEIIKLKEVIIKKEKQIKRLNFDIGEIKNILAKEGQYFISEGEVKQ